MSDLRTAAQQALEALTTPIHEQPFGLKQSAVTALRAALEQENGRPCSCRWVNDTMTQECTLHRIIKEQAHDWCERAKAAEAKLAALAQDVPETDCGNIDPVAWRFHDGKMWCYVNHLTDLPAPEFEPLYTTPPRREWQGLTDDDISIAYAMHQTTFEFARAIEAALKEKNT